MIEELNFDMYTLDFFITFWMYDNIIQIHNNVLWDCQYYIEYSWIFFMSTLRVGNITWYIFSPIKHCYGSI